MAKTTTTVKEYDDKGRLVKETITVVDNGGYHTYPYVLPASPSPTIYPYPYKQYPYTVWNTSSSNTAVVDG
jgi:hypothetical protein